MKTEKQQAVDLTNVLFKVSIGGCILLAIAVVIGLIAPLMQWQTLPEKVVVAKLTFVSIGLILGIFELLLGVLLAMLGIKTPYEVEAKSTSMAVKLVATSPAIVLIIFSNLLFAFCIMREFTAEEAKFDQDGKVPSRPAQGKEVEGLGTRGPR